MRKVLFPIIVTAIVLLSCKHENSNTSGGVSGGMTGGISGTVAVEYSVLTLAPRSVVVHEDFPATIEGKQIIEVRPMISGYIREICVNEGDRVRKGQLLFKISNPQYEQAVITEQASINSAQAEVNSAIIEVEKVRPLVEKDIVSIYRLESAEMTLKTKEALLEQAKASLANAESNLGYTIIKSPDNGLIGTIPYKVGALVSSASSEALTRLSDISEVFAYFSWNEKQLLDFLAGTAGNTVEEKVKSFPPATLILANGTEYSEKGKIEMASGFISTETGAATFKAIFPNHEGLIRSGSSAVIRIPEEHDSVLVIPQSATYELQNKRFVYVVSSENKVDAVNFSSIPTDDGKYFIVTEGLKTGDRIVTEGIASLKEGSPVIPKDTSAVIFYGNLY
jgi:membrane fusion protein (multidrug efflux system)